MRFLQAEIEQLEKLARASELLDALSGLSFKSAHGVYATPAFRAQQLVRARRRAKGAARLRKRIASLAATIESKAHI